MKLRSSIKKIVILALIIITLASTIGNAVENNSGDALRTNSCFEGYENDIFACRGKLPDVMDKEWNNSIRNCWLNLTRMGTSEFDSSFRGIGSRDRMLNVYLSSDYQDEIDEERLDKIYQKIESYCEEQEGIIEVPVVFMWQEDELHFPEYGPETFKRIQNEPWLVTTRGIVPVIEGTSEKIVWTDKLTKVTHNAKEVDKYFSESGGPIFGFGTSINGYITVDFNVYEPEKINNSLIDEIYLIIDEKAEEEGISDVPVVFAWSEGCIEESPGFSSILLVLSLLFIVRIRKKY
ncbi:hypothetical protein [Methanolobus sp. WCC4]|uniref:hypothetical protein n=1 Tax=Methanolobus sp. WCC4 TaxID=3125784 RepID=UPI0030F77EDC